MKGCDYTVQIGLFTKVRIWSIFCEISQEKDQNGSGFKSVVTTTTTHSTMTTIISFLLLGLKSQLGHLLPHLVFNVFFTYLVFCPSGLIAEGLFNFFFFIWVKNPPAKCPSGLNAEALFVYFLLTGQKM